MEPRLLRVFQMQVALQCAFGSKAADDLASSGIDPWYAIQNLMNATANVSKACWGTTPEQAKRRAPLRESLEIVDSSPLRIREMRNHWEHFDERLDTWWRESLAHNSVDLNIMPREAVSGFADIDIFRNFDPATGDLIFWGDTFNLAAIADEIRRVLPVARREAAKPSWETPREDA